MPSKDPSWLQNDLPALEAIEKETTRFVSEAMYLQLEDAAKEFKAAGTSSVAFASSVTPLAQASDSDKKIGDKFDYLGEDLTRAALDSIGFSRVPGARIFGAIDYKAARFHVNPDFVIDQALLVDSKVEKETWSNCRIQITQTSMRVRQVLRGEAIDIPGMIDPIWDTGDHSFLTTTIFVKYHYKTKPAPSLGQITVVALPHAFLQDVYNPDADDTIFNTGPDAPTLGEKFRTRISFLKLEEKQAWRVQRMKPGEEWSFRE